MTVEEGQEVADEIRGLLNTLKYATITLYCIVLLAVALGFLYLKDQTDTTNAALCTFKANLDTQIAQTEDYLSKHPEGFSGISAATLQRNVQNQKAASASLSTLDCPAPADLNPPSSTDPVP